VPSDHRVSQAQGADEIINYGTSDLKTILKERYPDGVDVVYDPVGGALTEAALRGMAWGGRHLVVGFASGEIPRIALNLPLLKGCQVIGVFWGDFTRREPAEAARQLAVLSGWARAGRIRPLVSQRFSLAEAHLALNAVAERRAVGKMVILP
jgi:NADPH2:quinone reductase